MPIPNKIPYSEHSVIVDFFKSSVKVEEIAAMYSVTPQTITRILRIHGIRQRPYGSGKAKLNDLDKVGMARMFESGTKTKDIAERYGVSRSTVTAVLRSFGVVQNVRYDEKKKKEVIKLYKLGKTYEEISSETGVPVGSCVQFVRKAGACNRNACRQPRPKEIPEIPRRIDGTPDIRPVVAAPIIVDEPKEERIMPNFKISKTTTIEGNCYTISITGDTIELTPAGREDVSSVFTKEYFFDVVAELNEIAKIIKDGVA